MLSSAKTSDTDVEVVQTVSVLSDFTRFMVRLPHSHGLSLAELGVLNALGRRGAIRISDLAAEQEMTQPGMTQLITRMERSGLVSRHGDPSDGRVVLVAVTETGAQVFHERDEDRIALFAELYEQLDEQEQRRLHDALPVLTRLMQIKEATADALSQ